MNEPGSETDVDRLLDELLRATSSCYDCFCKSEELSGIDMNKANNELEMANEKVNVNGNKIYLLSDGK